MKRKVLASIAAMILLGAATFAVLGILVNARIGRALATAKPVAELDAGGTQPIAVLLDGLRESLSIATDALRISDRSRATRALDAAMRASEVGKHAAGPGLAGEFDDANRRIKQARVALQDGRSADAAVSQDYSASCISVGRNSAFRSIAFFWVNRKR